MGRRPAGRAPPAVPHAGVHGVAATTPKGRTLHTLATGGCALLTAHTNADQAVGGVSEALALALGLTDLAPILPGGGRGRRPAPAGSAPWRRDHLRAFADHVAAALPATAHGVRVAGDPDRPVRRVALCGGAGDFLLDELVRGRTSTSTSPATCGTTARASSVEHDGPGAGRRRALGGRVDVAAGGGGEARRGAGRYGEDPREHPLHRSLAVPGRPGPLRSRARSPTSLESRPVRPAAAARPSRSSTRVPTSCATSGLAARDRPDRRAGDRPRRRRRPPARRADRRRRPDRRAEEGRRRRGAGQGPPHPRPRPHGPGPDHQPQGPRADAARAGVARAPDQLAGGRRARDHGAARGGPARRSTRSPPSWPRPTPRSPSSPSPATPAGSEIDALAGRGARRRARRAVEGMPEDLLALYERLRAKKGGVGAAALRARQCGGCQLTIDAAELGRDPGEAGRRGRALRGVPADPGPHRRSPGL